MVNEPAVISNYWLVLIIKRVIKNLIINIDFQYSKQMLEYRPLY